MQDTTCLSVIVPMYNVEKYLSLCLDSLFRTEGIEDTEIILIDDGSSDRTREIADGYAAKHPNITVLHQDNKGPSAARNLGISKACGRYIFFCDSDDEVDPELFKKMIGLTKTASYDLIMWDSDLIYDLKSLASKKNNGYFAHYGLDRTERTYTGKQIIETLIRKSKGFIATVWQGAYRRDYLISNNLFFTEKVIYEDELWVPGVLLKAETVRYIPEKVYLYRIRQGSITNPLEEDKQKNVESLMQVYPALYRFYDEALAGDPLKDLVVGNLTRKYLHMILRYRLYREHGKEIDRKQLWRTSRRFIDKIYVMILCVLTPKG